MSLQGPGGEGGVGWKAAVQAIINIPAAINGILVAMKQIFPGSVPAVVHTATGGPDTPPATGAGYMVVTLNGVQYKVFLYNM